MKTLCPGLYNAAKGTFNSLDPKYDFCPSLANTSCPNLCEAGSGPTKYLDWVMRACQADLSCLPNYSSCLNIDLISTKWVDYDIYSTRAIATLFPWKWRLNYDNTTAENPASQTKQFHCPSVAHKLTSFAIINVIVLFAASLFSRRDFVQLVTFKKCGKKGTQMWPLTALASVTLNLSANAINAMLTQHVPSFAHVPTSGLFLLWSSRPRLAWIAALLISVQKEESMYFALGVSTLLAEVILQTIGAVYLGMTVNHARAYGFYMFHHLDHIPNGKDALLMYAGAMLWLVSIGYVLVWALLIFTPLGNLLKKLLVAVASALVSASRALWRLTLVIWRSVRHFIVRCALKIWRLAIARIAIIRGQWRQSGQSLASDYAQGDTNLDCEELPQLPIKLYPNPEIYETNQLIQEDGENKEHRPTPRLTKKEKAKLRRELQWGPLLQRMGFTETLLNKIVAIVCMMILPWIGQWLFWVGFLRMASDL